MADNQLVLDGVSEKLRALQLNNLTAKQQNLLASSKENFNFYFKKLIYSFYGLSGAQLETFTQKELEELSIMVGHRAWPWAIIQTLFTFGVPIVGWLFGGLIGFAERDFWSWLYLFHRRRLKKAYGKNWFPHYERLAK